MNTKPLTLPISVVMISLNEGHNMEAVCQNLVGWADKIYLVDSYSQDDTVDIALKYGVHVVQRQFQNFGDQWNFALDKLPISTRWTMKLDPDERITDDLKREIANAIVKDSCDGISVVRRLWFMKHPLPVRQSLVRLWRTGKCRFTDVAVNEHPIVRGAIAHIDAEIEHHDSPDLDHWLEKQNRYTTAEAIIAHTGAALAAKPSIWGSKMQRKMWMKKNFSRIPLRFAFLFAYYVIVRGCWRAGWIGITWARLRCDVMRFRELKRREMEITGQTPSKRTYGSGEPDSRVQQYD